MQPSAIAEQRQHEAADPGASVWVSASAGTGKTKVLTDRVLSLMLAGTPPQRMLCLTFTRAAAAEMATRISDVLGNWTMLDTERLATDVARLTGEAPDAAMLGRARRLFAEVLETPGGMNIQTLHGFCQSLLRRFPLEAGLAPHFSLMDERDAEELMIGARETVLSRARVGTDEDLVTALNAVTTQIHELAFSDLLATLAANRGRLRHLIASAGGLDPLIERTYQRLNTPSDATPTSIIASACDDDAFEMMGLRLACQALADGSPTDQTRGLRIAEWVDAADRPASFPAYAEIYLTQASRNGPVELRKSLITKSAAAKVAGVAEILGAEAERIADIHRRLRRAVTADATAGLLHIGDALLTAYQQQKQRHAVLDYDDLILETGQLLSRDGVAPWVLYKLDGGIDHILIDEAQDTSPDQWRVVQALTGEYFAGAGTHETVRTVFAVGDVKQSIYSFQGADPASFRAMRDRFAAEVPAAQGHWREVDLTTSFRSTPPVLQAVDAVFAQPAANDGVALDGEAVVHEAHRATDGGLVEIWPALTPRPLDAPTPWKPPVERVAGDSPSARLAQLIAKRIHQMITNREILESKDRPIEPGDIMVLVRRRVGLVDDLVRALKNLEIDVAGVDRMVLTEHLAVMDLIALGRFLLLPDDDLTLATVLKGPLIGLSEEQLFELAHGRSGRLWAALSARAKSNDEFSTAHRALSELLALTDYLPPFELFAEILGARRGREKLLARLGPDAADPIGEFLSLALSYERTHPPSLEGFLYWLETGALEVKRDLEQGSANLVRVMTVHGAKGLEAPIVFLPDTLQVPTQPPRLLWLEDDDGDDELLLWAPRRGNYEENCDRARTLHDRRRDQEYRRLLYVAMTRAQDRLYICGWEGQRKPSDSCWYNLIRDGLEAAGLGETLTDPFLEAAEEIDAAEILRLSHPQTGEIDHSADTVSGVVPPLPDWAGQPAPAEPLPPTPLMPSRPDGEEPPTVSPLVAADTGIFQRGRLVHTLLQTLPDLAPARRAAAAKSFLAQPGHQLAETEQDEIADETLSLIADSTFAPLFGPDSRAEVPIVGRIGDTVVAGQLDRLVVGSDEIMIVDYKTNRVAPKDVGDVPSVYLRQLSAYRTLVAQIYSDRPIHCALLWTAVPRLMAVDTELLNAHAP